MWVASSRPIRRDYQLAKFGPNAFVCDACGGTHIWEKSEGTVQLDGVSFKITPDLR